MDRGMSAHTPGVGALSRLIGPVPDLCPQSFYPPEHFPRDREVVTMAGSVLVATTAADAQGWLDAHPDVKPAVIITPRSHFRARGHRLDTLVMTSAAVLEGVLDDPRLCESLVPAFLVHGT